MESYVLSSLQSVLPAYQNVENCRLLRLHSGTNTVLKVEAEGVNPIIFRKFGSCPLIDRPAEHRTFLRMAAAGLGPACLALGEGFRVEEFLPGRPIERGEMKDLVEEIAREVAKLHTLETGTGPSWLTTCIHNWRRLFIQRSDGYLETLSPVRKALAISLRSQIESNVQGALAIVPQPARLVLSHNDVSYTNILKHSKGVCLVDYEYSALNCPASDLATMANEVTYDYMVPPPDNFRYCPEDELSKERLNTLVETYCEASHVSEDEIWRDFLKCRAAIHFVGSLWAACMYSPDTDSGFDMLRYSAARLESYSLMLDKLP